MSHFRFYEIGLINLENSANFARRDYHRTIKNVQSMKIRVYGDVLQGLYKITRRRIDCVSAPVFRSRRTFRRFGRAAAPIYIASIKSPAVIAAST